MSSTSTTYWDYLRLLTLLDQQGGTEGDDEKLSEDELHFVVVHQVFELCLKLVLRELRLARDGLVAEWVPERHLPHIVRHLRRVRRAHRHGLAGAGRALDPRADRVALGACRRLATEQCHRPPASISTPPRSCTTRGGGTPSTRAV